MPHRTTVAIRLVHGICTNLRMATGVMISPEQIPKSRNRKRKRDNGFAGEKLAAASGLQTAIRQAGACGGY
jgi:hypothetical protein